MKFRLAQFGTQIVVASLMLSLGGCAVGGKSMSIDSTSKMPWFGLELKERKKKTSGPLFPQVKFDKGKKSYIEAIKGAEAESATAELASLPGKTSLSLPTTDQALALDSMADEPPELDFR